MSTKSGNIKQNENKKTLKFFSATIDGRNLIFGHKLHIGTPYRGKRFLTRQIPTSCLPKSGGIIRELLTIKISLNTKIIQTLQSNATNNNNVFDLQINVQCKQSHTNI
jgi:hypothetical protein